MKKIYIILLATYSTSLLSMEKLHTLSSTSCQDHTEEYPLYQPYSAHQQPIPVYLQANQPGWQQLNQIMDMTYKNEQPTIHNNPLMLTPVYRPNDKIRRTTSASKSIKQKEKKPLLPAQPHMNDIMQKLYDDACDCTRDIRKIWGYQWTIEENPLAQLIHAMNNARDKGIDEDMLGKFSYTKQTPNDFIKQMIFGKSLYDPAEGRTTLLFSCLKRYRLTVAKTGESLALDLTAETPNPAHLFNLSPERPHTYALYDRPITLSTLHTNPAFISLIYALDHLNDYGFETITHTTSCLYANPRPAVKNCSIKNSTSITKEFYNQAYDLLFNISNDSDAINFINFMDQLHAILALVETTKTTNPVNSERELAYEILDLGSTNATIIDLLAKYWDTKYSTIKRNRIALLCTLIEKYNKARGNKKTPTFIQHQTYALCKDLNLALPDSCNCNELKRKCYAFAEFKQLTDGVKKLIKADNEAIQRAVLRFIIDSNSTQQLTT